jgi:hypothetical protein
MTQMTTVKLALAAAGIAVWWYGSQSGLRAATWIGVGLLALAVLLRFIPRDRAPK